jgi:hypothetical protein
MAILILTVPSLSWGISTAIVSADLTADGIRSVHVDVRTGEISIDYDEASVTPQRINELLESDGYEIETVRDADQ